MVSIIIIFSRLVPFFSFLSLFADRYFQCEPMDATVSPIALTSSHHSNSSGGGNGGPPGSHEASNGSPSNPGTPTQ